MRGVDLLISLPPVLLGLLVLAVTPPGLGKTIAAVGLVYVPIMVRLTRAVALGLLEEDFVQAARARGEGAFPILWHEILPQCMAAHHRRVRAARDLRHPARLGSVVPGPRPAAARQRMGPHDRRGARLPHPSALGQPRPRPLPVRAWLVSVNLVGEGLRERLDPHLSGRAHA